MDRLISLLAALVGLIALAGAVMVEIHGQSERQLLVTELAAIRAELANLAANPPTAPTAAAPLENTGFAEALLALQSRIVVLEDATRSGSLTTEVASTAPTESSAPTGAGSTAADGPTEDCIPLGTRFMGQVGGTYPMCRSTTVITIADVTDGTAIIEGAGPITAGGFGKLGFAGCTVMVFSALAGFAELRVTCE